MRTCHATKQYTPSLATLRGCVLAIGGKDGGNPTGAIHSYDVVSSSWSVIGEIPNPRSRVMSAALGGWR